MFTVEAGSAKNSAALHAVLHIVFVFASDPSSALHFGGNSSQHVQVVHIWEIVSECLSMLARCCLHATLLQVLPASKHLEGLTGGSLRPEEADQFKRVTDNFFQPPMMRLRNKAPPAHMKAFKVMRGLDNMLRWAIHDEGLSMFAREAAPAAIRPPRGGAAASSSSHEPPPPDDDDYEFVPPRTLVLCCDQGSDQYSAFWFLVGHLGST